MKKKQIVSISNYFYSSFIIVLFSIGWINDAQAMKYHDNSVVFKASSSISSLIGGSFTVLDFYIRSKQDPKKHIYIGLKKDFNNQGSITFSIGRKGDKNTANWFNKRIPTSKTTFNHKAKKLNFALLGTLKLEFTGGILGAGRDTYTFQNIGLAQGHSFVENNWWFGGENCTNISKNHVHCIGTNSRGLKVTFDFYRGGVVTNSKTIHVTPIIVDTANWMGKLSGNLSLNELIMPGSHDAGLSETHHCNPIGLAKPYTKTQQDSIAKQLINGSRYFDIRVDYDHNQLVTYHRDDNSHGCNGQSLNDVLNQTVTFLKAHTTETAILKFSHIRKDDGHNPAEIKEKINILLTQTANNWMYKNSDSKLNLGKITLDKLRGKMVIVFDYDEHIDTNSGRFRYHDGCENGSSINLIVCDEYSDTASYDKMKNDQLKKWNEFSNLDADYLFLLSWTLTSKFSTDPKKITYPINILAKEANDNLPNVLYEKIMIAHAVKPNIVFIDFVNNKTTQSIIQYNYIKCLNKLNYLPTNKNKLKPGDTLNKGEFITSKNGRYRLIMQSDGNLVLYAGNSKALWASDTYNTAANKVIMQNDGNLVVYSSNGKPLWASNTYGKSGAELDVQNDGNLVIYKGDAIWATGTYNQAFCLNTK